MTPPPCANGSAFGHDFELVMEYRLNRMRVCVQCGVLELVWKAYDHTQAFRLKGPVDGTVYYRPVWNVTTSNPEGA